MLPKTTTEVGSTSVDTLYQLPYLRIAQVAIAIPRAAGGVSNRPHVPLPIQVVDLSQLVQVSAHRFPIPLDTIPKPIVEKEIINRRGTFQYGTYLCLRGLASI